VSQSVTSFFLDVEPMPSPRPRFRVIGKFASAYMPANYKAHTEALVAQLRSIDCEPRAGALVVDLVCWCAKPKTSKLTHPKPDIDNYAKTVMDAITKAGNLWSDDTQVVRLTAEKRWAPEGGHVGYSVSIKPLDHP